MNNALPPGFQFSQGSLQDFVDCPRRFQLKYIQQLAWPAVEAEPALENEHLLALGADFHRLAQQYFLGIPAQKLARLAGRDASLERWWEAFANEAEKIAQWQGKKTLPEMSLSTAIAGYRLVGKYDLLVAPRAGEGGFLIYDWKTSRKQPRREWLAAALQTRVYPYLLAKAGARLNQNRPIAPAQIEMVYWFTDFPSAPIRFPYSDEQFTADEADLSGLIAEIETLGETPAPLAMDEKRCRYCIYRSLCNRGVSAGPLDEMEAENAQAEFEFELNFEQIAEIEF
jgi:CRISPR/Cas system-associated exonuclease Cas4 (RecB family)